MIIISSNRLIDSSRETKLAKSISRVSCRRVLRVAGKNGGFTARSFASGVVRLTTWTPLKGVGVARRMKTTRVYALIEGRSQTTPQRPRESPASVLSLYVLRDEYMHL